MPLYQLHGTSVRAAARCVPPALGPFWSPNEELHLTGQRPSWGAPQDEGPLAHRRWAQRITELSLPAQEILRGHDVLDRSFSNKIEFSKFGEQGG